LTENNKEKKAIEIKNGRSGEGKSSSRKGFSAREITQQPNERKNHTKTNLTLPGGRTHRFSKGEGEAVALNNEKQSTTIKDKPPPDPSGGRAGWT